jgi:hypothetical protein
MVVNRGRFVVFAWWIVVGSWPLFWVEKYAMVLKFIFWVSWAV